MLKTSTRSFLLLSTALLAARPTASFKRFRVSLVLAVPVLRRLQRLAAREGHIDTPDASAHSDGSAHPDPADATDA